MADQTRAFRGNGGSGYPEQRQSAGGDPLAELARLIGGQGEQSAASSRGGREDAHWRPQSDPFGHPDPRVAAAHSEYPEPFPSSAEQTDPRYDAPAYGGYGQQPARQEAAPPQYGAPPPFQQGQGYGADPFYRDHDEHDEYDDNVPARRRGGMLTVMAVVALGLIGTAAAFGYRAVFSDSRSATPPVIKADTAPAKIVPAVSSNDQSKQIYDRVGERAPAERVVSREEKPVDLADTLKNPRIIGTAPAPVANPVAQLGAPSIPANASALAAPNAPGPAPAKRVRTVTIKPDGTDAEAPAVSSARAGSMPSAPPARVERGPGRGASASAQDTETPPQAAPVPIRTVTTRRAAPPPDPNAPLSLTPSPAAGAAPVRAPMRTASAPAAPAATGNGGYSVQVSSQRSEAEAQSAFRSLQSKFPSQLGGQQPVIRRADLGDKGVFYRVQVGPFDSGQASELCGNLKNAGGSCVVQRN